MANVKFFENKERDFSEFVRVNGKEAVTYLDVRSPFVMQVEAEVVKVVSHGTYAYVCTEDEPAAHKLAHKILDEIEYKRARLKEAK